jgi:phosphoglycolate phosphatase
MDVRAVLFDFDFTLADPSGWLISAWVEALAAIGVPRPNHATLKTVVGKPLKAQYSRIVGEPPLGARFEMFQRFYLRYRDAHAPEETRILPSVATTLSALKTVDIMLGIVSTGVPERLIAILKRAELEKYFSTIKAASKDKVAGIVEAISSLGVKAAATVYVGDHPDDCRAAEQARVTFFAVRTGVNSASDFPAGTAVLTSVAELPSRLLGAPGL